MKGPIDRKLKCMTTLFYTVAKEQFGTKKTRRPKPQQTPNRRQSSMKQIRGELKSLNKAYKKASQDIDSKGEELQTHQPVQNNIFAKRGRQYILRHLSQNTNNLPYHKWVH
ncbi:hypothetical protein DPMN_033895 [Dreissena polymorpha]|uniref:Uncharacterized protein n=1 Tax=Dreissena polymorpha TaxID=45954 RepID=A0A9D4RJK1_DREPO|nr:hypothetical protein DPMN_033895 [Dreissena polymorpha]